MYKEFEGIILRFIDSKSIITSNVQMYSLKFHP